MKINLFQNHTYFRAQGKIRTGPFFGPFGREGGRPSVLREGQDAVYQYSGRNGKQTVDTEEEMEDELLVRREVDVFVTATNNGVFIESYNLF